MVSKIRGILPSEKNNRKIKILLAGKKIEINCFYKTTVDYCHDYIVDFETPDMVVDVLPTDFKEELMPMLMRVIGELELNSPESTVTYEYDYLEPIVVYQKIVDKILKNDVVLMHGSVVAINNNGYMFTAKSGVGKTTRTKLWKDCFPDSIVVNGDKPLVRIDKDEVLAFGTPWCGKEGWNANVMVPLKAIMLLERANGQDDRIEEIGIAQAFPFLLQQTYRPIDKQAMMKTIALLKRMAGKVKFYRFISSPTQESIHMAYETLRSK